MHPSCGNKYLKLRMLRAQLCTVMQCVCVLLAGLPGIDFTSKSAPVVCLFVCFSLFYCSNPRGGSTPTQPPPYILHPILKGGVQVCAKCLPKGPKPTKEALATAKLSHVPKGGGHQEVNHARNFKPPAGSFALNPVTLIASQLAYLI